MTNEEREKQTLSDWYLDNIAPRIGTPTAVIAKDRINGGIFRHVSLKRAQEQCEAARRHFAID